MSVKEYSIDGFPFFIIDVDDYDQTQQVRHASDVITCPGCRHCVPEGGVCDCPMRTFGPKTEVARTPSRSSWEAGTEEAMRRDFENDAIRAFDHTDDWPN